MLSKNFMLGFIHTLRFAGYHDWDIRREWRAFELLRRVGVWGNDLGYK